MKKSIALSFIFSLICIYRISAAPFPAKKQINYRTSFGQCPSRSVGSMTLKLIKAFESTGSLKEVKQKIIEEKLDQKHFVSDYKIKYDPFKKMLQFKYDCPDPLMKVQIYKKNTLDSYEAILVDNGKLYDPTYEVLLRTEKKLTSQLPFLALPLGEMEESTQHRITSLVKKMGPKFRKKLSEVILNEGGDLTVILSVQGNPSSVFLGKGKWPEKVEKLKKIINYMQKKRRIPAVINLTNSQKVVVKFNERF